MFVLHVECRSWCFGPNVDLVGGVESDFVETDGVGFVNVQMIGDCDLFNLLFIGRGFYNGYVMGYTYGRK